MTFVKALSKGTEMLVSHSQMPYMWTETAAVRQAAGLAEENRLRYCKGCSFLSRSIWQRNPSWRPGTYHPSLFNTVIQLWSSRNHAVFPASSDLAYCQQGQHSAPASHSQGWSPYPSSPAPASHSQGWSPYLPSPQPQGGLPYQPAPAPLASLNQFREWRLRKASLEDKEREMRGEPPKKQQTKESYRYTCKICGQSKSKLTGHTLLHVLAICLKLKGKLHVKAYLCLG
ncbi:uncharacterized protein LOC118290261 [Scophthalmus maximus]|uniref:uncharacterized protein LOC118290261 n=1 Tax=Scophthalmus maximus TaxID=52904 RepID=UPI001FA92AFA|nr:uncharacterized protein LOC118290261 [Scophthalmus maximus]